MQPVLSVADVYVAPQGGGAVTGNMQATFDNCIFWGGNGTFDNEVAVTRQGTGGFSVGFTNCLWKVKAVPSGVTSSGMIMGVDPLFDSVSPSRNYYDLHLQAGSPAIDKGAPTGLAVDLDGSPRVVGGAPDMGCYERQ